MIPQLDFYRDVTRTNWKRKYGEVFDPDSGEILAHVTLTPSDFTRRKLNVKMTKWFGQYAKGKHVEYILSRIDNRSIGLYAGDSSWFRLIRTQAVPKPKPTPKAQKPTPKPKPTPKARKPDLPPCLVLQAELAAPASGQTYFAGSGPKRKGKKAAKKKPKKQEKKGSGSLAAFGVMPEGQKTLEEMAEELMR